LLQGVGMQKKEREFGKEKSSLKWAGGGLGGK